MRRLTESFAFEGKIQQVQGIFDTAQKRFIARRDDASSL